MLTYPYKRFFVSLESIQDILEHILDLICETGFDQGVWDEGVKVIELCAGFGNEGVAVITRAVHGRARVGAVKFDCHPGLDFKSGDELFA